jgi:hypothetical protein
MRGIPKYQDESWMECAKRLGKDARYEGRSLDVNPFPKGFLRSIWAKAWLDTDARLDSIKLRKALDNLASKIYGADDAS